MLIVNIRGFIKAQDIRLSNYDFDTLVAGHLTRLGPRNDVIIQREFVSHLEMAAAQANQQVSFGEVAKQVGGGGDHLNHWLIFPKYIDTVGENCINYMLPKWENNLGREIEFMSTQIVLPMPSLGELFLLHRHYSKTKCLYTKKG